ncbi:phosphoglucan phosphatase LSF2, chloroplastic-like [Malus domestica]|uniref:phosphoglucan phosphatase LSF2, chloroplastic-like n=1 Tax=Malus domestica TaxID=3750 RepID=UPI0004991A50|nr:phosphoglucan phosphatase LSF2, chloroplastic-like [Malus domestica]
MEEYNTAMKKMMRNPYEYHHDLGFTFGINVEENEQIRYYNGLPKAVASLEWAVSKGKGKVCVHCTAGLGRAPAVAVAYIYWFLGMNKSHNAGPFYGRFSVPDFHYTVSLTSKRPCGPSKMAISGATYYLTKKDPWKEPLENLPEYAFEDIADWERNLIRDRVCSLRGT